MSWKRGVFCFAIAALGALAAAQEEAHPQIIVRYKSHPRDLSTYAVKAAIGGEQLSYDVTRNRAVLELRGGTTAEQGAAIMRQLPNVLYAEPNIQISSFRVVNDPMVPDQWSLVNGKVTEAWDHQTGSSDIIIAIVDTGVDTSHPDLAGRLVSGYDFIDNDADPWDGNGHGTHCAGIAAANADNSTGIAGVAFGCRVMPVRVLNNTGVGMLSTLIEGVEWAADHGAKIISLSLGTPSESRAMADAMDYAWEHGALVVAAAGNEATNRPTYPAAYPKVLSVAATDRTNKRAPFSNYGPWVDVAAPGALILSTLPNNKYGSMSGTSMATPFVAGVAGLVWAEMGPNANPASVSQRIEATADSFVPWVTRGRVNALAALSEPASPNEFEIQAIDSTVTGGNRARARVILTKSSDQDRVFAITTSGGALVAPATLTIRKRQNSGMIMLNTLSVVAPTPVQLTLSSAGITKTATLTVNPVSVRDFKFTRSAIAGGKPVLLGIYLDAPAPSGGLAVGLSTSDPALSVPANYTVRAGTRQIFLTAKTTAVTSTTNVTVTLTQGSVTRSASISIQRGK